MMRLLNLPGLICLLPGKALKYFDSIFMTKAVLIRVGRSVGRECGINFRTFEYNQKDRGEHQATMHSSIFFLYSRHRRPERPKLSQRIREMYRERDAHDGERTCDGSVKTIRRKRAKKKQDI